MADNEFQHELAAFVAHCSSGMKLMDIGASHGVFSLAALHFGGSDARVVAVDPSPVSNRLLRANLKLNSMEHRCQVVECAIGAENGSLSMITTGPSGDHYFVGITSARSDAIEAHQCTIGTLSQRTGLIPTHVKIDVEGFEGDVVQGGMKFFSKHRPIIFLELHGQMIRDRGRLPQETLRYISECGYTRFERNGVPVSIDSAARMDIARVVCLPWGEGSSSESCNEPRRS